MRLLLSLEIDKCKLYLLEMGFFLPSTLQHVSSPITVTVVVECGGMDFSLSCLFLSKSIMCEYIHSLARSGLSLDVNRKYFRLTDKRFVCPFRCTATLVWWIVWVVRTFYRYTYQKEITSVASNAD